MEGAPVTSQAAERIWNYEEPAAGHTVLEHFRTGVESGLLTTATPEED